MEGESLIRRWYAHNCCSHPACPPTVPAWRAFAIVASRLTRRMSAAWQSYFWTRLSLRMWSFSTRCWGAGERPSCTAECHPHQMLDVTPTTTYCTCTYILASTLLCRWTWCRQRSSGGCWACCTLSTRGQTSSLLKYVTNGAVWQRMCARASPHAFAITSSPRVLNSSSMSFVPMQHARVPLTAVINTGRFSMEKAARSAGWLKVRGS